MTVEVGNVTIEYVAKVIPSVLEEETFVVQCSCGATLDDASGYSFDEARALEVAHKHIEDHVENEKHREECQKHYSDIYVYDPPLVDCEHCGRPRRVRF